MSGWNQLFADDQFDFDQPHEKFSNFFKEHEKKYKVNTIIDLGCGTGRNALYLSEKGYQVHAVDNAENALDKLKKKAAHISNIRISNYDLGDMSEINEQYDLGVCINVLSHGRINEIRSMFFEIEKVIKNGGFLFIVLTPESFINYVKQDKTTEVEKNSYLYINAPDGEIIHHFFTESELRDLLKNYKDVKIELIKEYSLWLKKEVEHYMIVAEK